MSDVESLQYLFPCALPYVYRSLYTNVGQGKLFR